MPYEKVEIDKRKVANVLDNCTHCKVEICLKPWEMNRKLKSSRQGLIFCSVKCAARYYVSVTDPQVYKDRKLAGATLFTTEQRQETNRKTKARKNNELSPFRIFLNGSRKKGHREYGDLTLECLKKIWDSQEGKCALTGVPMEIRATTLEVKKQPRTPLYGASLDRIDSNIDYMQNNVQFVCKGANLMKNNHTNDEALEFVKMILEFGKNE